MKFEKPSANELEKICEELAQRIKKRKFKPDVIVGIARGGWFPALFLSDRLGGIRDVRGMRIEQYTGINETGELRVTAPVHGVLRGKNVLLVDDVADKGLTLKTAVTHLKRKGAKSIVTATLHYKPHSVFKPDFYIKETTAWIIYPWAKEQDAAAIAQLE